MSNFETNPSGTMDELKRMRKLVKLGEAVVEDFMPNIGNCVLQDYGRLNEFLMEADRVRDDEED